MRSASIAAGSLRTGCRPGLEEQTAEGTRRRPETRHPPKSRRRGGCLVGGLRRVPEAERGYAGTCWTYAQPAGARRSESRSQCRSESRSQCRSEDCGRRAAATAHKPMEAGGGASRRSYAQTARPDTERQRRRARRHAERLSQTGDRNGDRIGDRNGDRIGDRSAQAAKDAAICPHMISAASARVRARRRVPLSGRVGKTRERGSGERPRRETGCRLQLFRKTGFCE